MKSPLEIGPSRGMGTGMQIDFHWAEEGLDQCPIHHRRLVPPTSQSLTVLGLGIKSLFVIGWDLDW